MQAHALARRAPSALAVAAAIAAAALTACKLDDAMPPTPAAAAADTATRESARLRAHVLTIPGVSDASVVVTIPAAAAAADPFARTPAAAPARVAFVVATTAGADSGVIGDAALTAARAALGADADIHVQIAPTPPAPRLVSVGPFDVSADSRAPLLATLVVALVLVAGLAAALAVALTRGYRRGTRPQ